MEDVYVIIPVYNEEKMVGKVINDVHKHFPKVICINDGSKDDSGKVIAQAGGVLVEHAINLGAGAAIQTGVDYALLDKRAKYFVTFDADGQHDVKDAVRMLEHLKKNDLDIVFGSRFLGIVRNISGIKRRFLKLAAIFNGVTSGLNLTDPHIGLRVFNRKFAENLKLTMPDFAHASEIVDRVEQGKYRYAEVPASVTYSDYSKAKGQPMLNAVNIVFDVLIQRFTKK